MVAGDAWSRAIATGRRDDPLDAAARQQFRVELSALQTDLRNYTRLLADMADVEDLTDLEAV